MNPAFVSDSIGDEEEEEEEDEESPSSPSTSNDVAGDDPATTPTQPRQPPQQQRRNRYDEQKQRDWKTFLRFLDNRKPRLTLSRVRSPHVMEFLESIDSFGKTLVHEAACPFFGRPDPPSPPCACPLRQSWGSLDALVGRLRASCDEAPARPETNPFGVRAVRNFLLRVKDAQATARGIPYSRKRKSRIGTEPVDASAATVSFPSQTDLLECSASAPEEAAANPCFSAPVGEEEYSEQPGGTHDASPGDVPFLGSDGQDGPVPLQVCWVRPPVTENQSTPPFYPIWRYPAMQSLVPFLPPFPYMPLPTPQKEKEKEMRIPKPEAQLAEDHPSEGPSSSNDDLTQASAEHPTAPSQQRNRYEEQKKRDWNTFLRFLENREPRLTLSRVRSPHVMEFLKSIDQFGKTLVHESGCPYFGNPNPAAPCACPLRQSWGSLDALVGRLRASCEESPNRPETNPFGVRAVRNYLLQVKDNQATARGIPYSRKRKRNLPTTDILPIQANSGDVVADAGGESTATLAAVSSSYLEAEESGAFHVDDSSTYQEESASTYLMMKESSSASSL